MSLNQIENALSGCCPVCEAMVVPDSIVEESEILTCSDCLSMLVVESVIERLIHLEEAPIIEEDWGE